jgi:two-component system phosphate regulon sensor histidine kinase PhoR
MISKAEAIEKDKKLSFYSQVIKSEHDKLRQRVEELLKTSFSEAIQPLYNEYIDASIVIENVLAAYSVQIKEKGGKFTFIKEGESFKLLGNIDLFNTAVGNIVDNAIRYCNTKPEIDILLTSKNSIIGIEISDNGIGIPKDQQSRIFEKYYRVPTGDIHDNDGFGLGLFHVKNITTKMGGKIKVVSSKGSGSCFTLEIPVASGQ